jgi:hypothetical protein
MAINKNKLLAAVAPGHARAVAPHSQVQVGLAWLAPSGAIISGAGRQLLAENAPTAKGFVADSADLKAIRPFHRASLPPKSFPFKLLKIGTIGNSLVICFPDEA